MDEDDCLDRFGLLPEPTVLPQVRELLLAHASLERQAQGRGDTELMKLCCVQLFNHGQLDDVLLIWHAKTSSMDADASIDVQLLCGAGLGVTKRFLASSPEPEAQRAWERITTCEKAGDFAGFSPTEHAAQYVRYYGVTME